MDQDQTSGSPRPDNAEDTMKCPICGAMVNIGAMMGEITCPVCGRSVDREEVRILGASNEDY